MERIKDFLEVSKIALSESLAKLSKSYMVFIFILINTIFENNHFSLGLFGQTVGGLVSYFISVIIACFIAQSLISVVKFGNTGKSSLENSMGNFFGPMVSTRFFLYLIEIFIQLLMVNFPAEFRILIGLILNILFSAMYEEIYLNGLSGFDALRESAIFVKNNFLTYGLYSVLFLGLEFYLSARLGLSLNMGKNKILACIVVSLIHTAYMIFRGHLFKYLNEHAYRQRKFMRGR